MGLISAVSGPLIFLSVLGSICSMGNMETLGKIGSKTIKVILLYMTVIAVLMTAFGCLFYHIEMGGGVKSSFSQILDLIYDIIKEVIGAKYIVLYSTGRAVHFYEKCNLVRFDEYMDIPNDPYISDCTAMFIGPF